MELKDILGEDLAAKVQTAVDAYNSKADKKAKLVDLSGGDYVSKEKHTDKLTALQSQIDDYKTQVGQRDKDLADLQDKLKAAGPEKLDEVSKSLADLQARYDQDQKDWQSKLDAQAYSFLIKEKASELSFSSGAAKREFIREATEKGFKIDGETLLGYGDWLKAYQEADPGAFASAPAADTKPTITKPATPATQTGAKMSLEDMMKAANADPNFVPNFN